MSDLMKDPMILRSIIMDHYEYPRNHELTKEDGYVQKHIPVNPALMIFMYKAEYGTVLWRTCALTVWHARSPLPPPPS